MVKNEPEAGAGEDMVVQLGRDLGRRHGVAEISFQKVEGSRWRSGASARRHPTPQIRYTDEVLSRPVDAQNFTVAHEVAHLAMSARQHRGSASLAWTAVLMLGGLIILATAALSPTWGPTTTAAVAAGVAAAVVGYLGIGAVSRSRERAADQLAATWGFPLTLAAQAHMEAVERAAGLHRWPTWLRTHPTPAARAAALATFEQQRGVR